MQLRDAAFFTLVLLQRALYSLCMNDRTLLRAPLVDRVDTTNSGESKEDAANKSKHGNGADKATGEDASRETGEEVVYSASAEDTDDASTSGVTLPTCVSGRMRKIKLEDQGDSVWGKFTCPRHLPFLDPSIVSGEVYSSAAAEKPVALYKYYPNVFIMGTPHMGYSITAMKRSGAPQTLFFRCTRTLPRSTRSKMRRKRKLAETRGSSATDDKFAPTPTTGGREKSESAMRNLPENEQSASSCVILITIPGREQGPGLPASTKRVVNSFFEKTALVDRTPLFERTGGEDQPLRVCVGDSITLIGKVHKNLLFACATDLQDLSPRHPEFVFPVARKNFCQVGNPRALDDFLPNAFRLETGEGTHIASLLLKQREQQYRTEAEMKSSFPPRHTGVDVGVNSSPKQNDITQVADELANVTTVYKLVLTDLPHTSTKFCYQCKGQLGYYESNSPTPDCTIFVEMKGESSAGTAPQAGFACWVSVTALLSFGWGLR